MTGADLFGLNELPAIGASQFNSIPEVGIGDIRAFCKVPVLYSHVGANAKQVTRNGCLVNTSFQVGIERIFPGGSQSNYKINRV